MSAGDPGSALDLDALTVTVSLALGTSLPWDCGRDPGPKRWPVSRGPASP